MKRINLITSNDPSQAVAQSLAAGDMAKFRNHTVARAVLLALAAWLISLIAPSQASASTACPTGTFDIFSTNDATKNFAGQTDVVIGVDAMGNCSGAIGWTVPNSSTEVELRLDQFAYSGDGWFDAWNRGNPADKYTILIDQDGDAQLWWGASFTGHAKRMGRRQRKIRITNQEARQITDMVITLGLRGSPSSVWGWARVPNFDNTSYFGHFAFYSSRFGTNDFLYLQSSELGGKQIVINKLDPRDYVGDIALEVTFKVDGQTHYDYAVFHNWSDAGSSEYSDFIVDTVGSNGSWNGTLQRWEGNFLRPATITTACPAPGRRQVTIYQNANFTGKCAILGVGNYPHSDAFAPVGNDSVSSLDVGDRVFVTLFQNANFTGRTATFGAGKVAYVSDKSNDMTSSMAVQTIR